MGEARRSLKVFALLPSHHFRLAPIRDTSPSKRVAQVHPQKAQAHPQANQEKAQAHPQANQVAQAHPQAQKAQAHPQAKVWGLVEVRAVAAAEAEVQNIRRRRVLALLL